MKSESLLKTTFKTLLLSFGHVLISGTGIVIGLF